MSDVANQPRDLPLHISKDICSGKTYIVTGANTGLGFEAAKHLVAVDAAKVILAVRNTTAGEEAKAKIVEATGKEHVAEVWALDLSSYESVKAFAKKASNLDRIDALIENAGLAMSQRTLAEGHVLPLTVNVFSNFLLAVLLLPKLTQDAKKFGILPHIAVVSSRAGFDFQDDWEKIKDDPLAAMDSEDMVTMKTYPLSKLLEIMGVHHLASLLPVSRTGVVINTVCPGLCKTDLSRNAPPAFRESLVQQWAKYGRTAEEGSRTLLHGAVAGKESHGHMLASCEILGDKIPSWVASEEFKQHEKQVWDGIAKELESIQPGCVKKILE